MGKRGPQPLPDAVKEARGTLKRSRTNPDAPKLPTSIWEPPAELKGEGLEEWTRLVKAAQESGLLTDGDRETFLAYCQMTTTVRRLQRLVARSSVEVAIAKGYMKHLNTTMVQYRQLAAALGLTPASRGSVKKAEKKVPGKLEQFIRRVK
jgi:P27 family predicted phage terminase small subunit